MNVIVVIIKHLIYLMESFIYWRLLSGALEAKYQKKSLIAAAAALFSIIVIKQAVFSLPSLKEYLVIGSIILLSYSFLSIMLLSKSTFYEKLIWSFVYIFGSAIMELVPLLIIKLFLNKPIEMIPTDQVSQYIMFFGKFFNVLLFEAIIRKRKGNFFIGAAYFKELIIIVTWNLFLLTYTVYVFTNKHNILLKIENVVSFIFGVVFLITVYLVILIFRLEKKSKEELETQLKLQQIELELKLNNDMINVTDKLRKLRHDMNNHIGLIKGLVHSKKYDDLEEYINQIYEDVEIANELVITSNKTLSVLLSTKRSLAKAKNIDFTSMITAQDFQMQNKDVCALLGNILDNAIEAAEKSSGKKYIELMIQKTEEGCVINCENSIGIKPMVKKGRFVTVKENSLLHGIGISNIKDIVAKYKGEINFEYDDEMFHVRVIMPV